MIDIHLLTIPDCSDHQSSCSQADTRKIFLQPLLSPLLARVTQTLAMLKFNKLLCSFNNYFLSLREAILIFGAHLLWVGTKRWSLHSSEKPSLSSTWYSVDIVCSCLWHPPPPQWASSLTSNEACKNIFDTSLIFMLLYSKCRYWWALWRTDHCWLLGLCNFLHLNACQWGSGPT